MEFEIPQERELKWRYDAHTQRIKRDTLKFWHYRHRNTKQEAHDYSAFWTGRRIPWADATVNGPPPAVPYHPALVRPNYAYQVQRLEGSVPRDARELQAMNRRNEVMNFFNNDPKYEFSQTLGVGGNGIAVRYEIVGDNPPPDLPTEIAVKFPLRSWQDKGLRREIHFMRKFARSRHILQLVDPVDLGREPLPTYESDERSDDSSDDEESSGEEGPNKNRPKRKKRSELTREELARKKLRWDPWPKPPTPRPQRQGFCSKKGGKGKEKEVEPAKDYMISEFAGFGNLTDFISLVARKNEVIPNRVIWRFWLCLVRGIVGMAFPPRKFNPDWKTSGKDLLDEVTPADDEEYELMKRYVHFDLDPANIFMFEFDTDSPEHDLAPIIKIADFGLSEEVKTEKRDTYYTKMRYKGKPGYYAPEQFTEGWDYMSDMRNGSNICRQPVVGNYGPHTNVWAIGCILFNLVTGHYPPQPPQAANVQLVQGDGSVGAAFTTYGELALRPPFAHVDGELRALVVRCMAHLPAARPSLRELLAGAIRGLNRSVALETDDDVIAWHRRIFTAPTQPAASSSSSGSSSSGSGSGGGAAVGLNASGLAPPSSGGAGAGGAGDGSSSSSWS
ncbi:kinase-like domain-containing protein [Biscogniauxia mediterranea]|nr:kinase-like domain-containing protein [Biscogniauxia mediterranea]